MKKEDKYPLYGLALGVAAGVIIYMLDQYVKLKRQGLPYWQNLNKKQLLKYGGIGGGVGLVAGWSYSKFDFHQESKKSFNSNGYTKEILNLNNGNGHDIFLKAKNIGNEIKQFLELEYSNKLAGKVEDWGSTARGTSTLNFDIDLLIPFSRRSYSTLEQMYEDLYLNLEESFPDFDVRKQGHSIGMTCVVDNQELHYDIVPGREINNYQIDREVNLFVKGGMFKSHSRIKTNVSVPKELTVNRPKEREIVKLIKIYRDRYGFNIKSTFLQHLVFEAFDNVPPTTSTSANLKYAMGYLADKLPYARIVDPGNSNNVISTRVNEASRNQMADQLAGDLRKLEKNKSYLKEVFPV